jgi:hypothetical protein
MFLCCLRTVDLYFIPFKIWHHLKEKINSQLNLNSNLSNIKVVVAVGFVWIHESFESFQNNFFFSQNISSYLIF